MAADTPTRFEYGLNGLIDVLQRTGHISGDIVAPKPGKKTAQFHPVRQVILMGLTSQITGDQLSEHDIMRAVAEVTGLPFVIPDPLRLNSEFVTGSITRPYAEANYVLPIERTGSGVVVAMANPFDNASIDAVKSRVGVEVSIVVAAPSDIRRVVQEIFGFHTSVKKADAAITAPRPQSDVSNLEQLIRIRGDREIEASDQHIVNAVDYLLRFAVQQRASDIHIEPKRTQAEIRFRIDGVLHTVNRIPVTVQKAMVARLKLMSRMDIAEQRRPQDGRIKLSVDDREVEIRASTLPVLFGQKMVLRLFDPSKISSSFDELGFSESEQIVMGDWIGREHGMILVTGPTGSGKSTTLYTSMKRIASDEINITTIEDPVEVVVEELNQIAVQPAIDVTFSTALRTILRQDPDVIMVGEIRDADTARYAIQAALTGHLVLSTLHTNDAPSAIDRMRDLGVDSFLLASVLVGVMAQRLVRVPCKHCGIRTEISTATLPPSLRAMAGSSTVEITLGQGCQVCRGTGYLGRTTLLEMLNITKDVRQAIHDGKSVSDIRRLATGNGMSLLLQSGWKKILEGQTTPDEVYRVTGLDVLD